MLFCRDRISLDSHLSDKPSVSSQAGIPRVMPGNPHLNMPIAENPTTGGASATAVKYKAVPR